MAIMQYHNIFARDKEEFEILYTAFYKLFSVEYKELKRVIEYYSKLKWLEATENNTGFIVKINYNEIENFRNKYLKTH
ncbi:MAG: hypothetical protein IJH39_03975 [Clostridia bacterium]|nr:hypothetical protein [Clostridia bacterium]